MASFDLLATQELISLTKQKNVAGYKNMLRQQLESIFITPFSSKPTP